MADPAGQPRREVIESAVAGATRMISTSPRAGCADRDRVPTDLDRRRRAVAASIVRSLVTHAIRGEDGTVSWIAPVIGLNGVGIQPLMLDLYGGLPGVAVLVTAYQREVAGGAEPDPVPGADELGAQVLRSLIAMDDRAHELWQEQPNARPDPPGAYIGTRRPDLELAAAGTTGSDSARGWSTTGDRGRGADPGRGRRR